MCERRCENCGHWQNMRDFPVRFGDGLCHVNVADGMNDDEFLEATQWKDTQNSCEKFKEKKTDENI